MKGKIYGSGPMSNMPDLNFPAFHRVAAILRAGGWEVINPAELNADSSKGWRECMRVDIAALVTCDAITKLPGWENSRGAKLELHIAEALGLEVVELEGAAA